MQPLMTTLISIARLKLICTTALLACTAQADVTKRSPEDVARDTTSKPFEVLKFMGVKPGWHVIDLFAGNGYYSEVLAHVVGKEGKVYLHNNAAYMGFATKLNERLKDNRLSNVEVYVREIEDINLPSNSLDMAIMVMVYHDAYFQQSGWTVKPDPLFKTIHRILKPGGVLAVIDHHAQTGTGSVHAQNLHRIDANFAKKDIEQRGFILVGSSPLLENSADNLTQSVFDPAIRGKTSRFIYKFIKH